MSFANELCAPSYEVVAAYKSLRLGALALGSSVRGVASQEPSRVLQCEVRWPVRRVEAIGAPGPTLGEVERAWERAQVRIEALVAAGLHDEEPAVVAASKRLQNALFRGPSDAQRPPARKVAYARVQLCLTSQRPLSYDVALVGLDDALVALEEATEALSLGLGADRPAARRPALVNALPRRFEARANDNAASGSGGPVPPPLPPLPPFAMSA